MANPKLKVVICYVSSDYLFVYELDQLLRDEKVDGFNWIETWVAKRDILAGKKWELEIQNAIDTAGSVVVCLSNSSISKEGHIQKEIDYAIEKAKEKPEGTVFLIPLRLEECDPPRRVRDYQWVDYFGEEKATNYRNILIKSLMNRYLSLGGRRFRRSNFIGRDKELRKILYLLSNPTENKRVIYIEGVGGIGKTRIILEVLNDLLKNKARDYLTPFVLDYSDHKPQIIDFFSTENRTIDGIRETIIQYLGEKHFEEYFQRNKNTHRVFRKCLQELVKERPVLLAFDTFETVHNDPLTQWIFDDGEDGLQMPGLVCLIGSRPPEPENQKKVETLLRSNPYVERIKLTGITYQEAVDMYQMYTDLRSNQFGFDVDGFLGEVVRKAEGNPLLIELIINLLNLSR